MTTGMIRPSWSFAEVLALNALQKSMMFTPCGPSAVPTGGAGVALPAGICSFTCPVTFFAICLCLFYLQKFQFHRSRTTKDRDHDAQRAALHIHVLDLAREIGERSLDNADVFVLLEREFGARTLR